MSNLIEESAVTIMDDKQHQDYQVAVFALQRAVYTLYRVSPSLKLADFAIRGVVRNEKQSHKSKRKRKVSNE